jgi:hypothetical protein
MKNLGFLTFYKNLHPRSRSWPKKLRLRLQQKGAAPPAPALQHRSLQIRGTEVSYFFLSFLFLAFLRHCYQCIEILFDEYSDFFM